MNFINTTQTYGRPISPVSVHQQFGVREGFALPGGIALWKSGGKIAAGIVAVVFLVNMGISSLVARVDKDIAKVETLRQELVAKKEVLDGYKKELWSKENIARLAGKKLALQLPVEGQIVSLR